MDTETAWIIIPLIRPVWEIPQRKCNFIDYVASVRRQRSRHYAHLGTPVTICSVPVTHSDVSANRHCNKTTITIIIKQRGMSGDSVIGLLLTLTLQNALWRGKSVKLPTTWKQCYPSHNSCANSSSSQQHLSQLKLCVHLVMCEVCTFFFYQYQFMCGKRRICVFFGRTNPLYIWTDHSLSCL